MGYNVAEIAENFITKDIVSKASGFLDESESSISKAVSVIIPIIVAKVADKSTSTYGATLVAQMATEQHNSGICVDINNFFGQEGGRFLNKGASLYNGLFGQSTDKLTDTVSNFAAVKPATTISLMSMGVPLILGIIGKKAAAENLPAGEIASFISSQKNEIMSAIPSGINLNGVFDGNNQLINTLAASKKSNIMTSHQVEETNTQETDNGLRWLLPILLLIFLAALCWYFMGKAPAHTEEAMAEHTEHGVKPAEEHAEVMTTAAGKVDSLQNFVYELGKMVTIELPNNAGKLEVGEYSTENKLFKFLSDKDAKLDSVKGNWFEFTNVRFKTGGTQIDSSSLVQLKNMVMFCKGFPAAQFKVGGYTDNSGDSAKNVILSEKRASAVLAEIIKQGAAATSFTGAKGYGPEHPIGDNATAEGKAMNRRVAVNVKAK